MNRIASSLLTTTVALSLPLTLTAQTQIAQPQIPPPVSPVIVEYQYWPTQYVQWLGAELPYSMLELDVDAEGKNPIYKVVLTDRATGRRVQYTNNVTIAAAAKAQGNEVHPTEIAFEPADTTTVGSVSTLRLALANGKPLQWHFVQGSEVSEQGSGLTPLGQLPIPVFAYREQGAVAGEGTAVQIGEIVSAADMWKEISHPPYFVGYRGAYTQHAHRLIFAAGKQAWTIASAPTSLSAGAAWEMDGENGAHRTLKLDRVEGVRYFFSGIDRLQPSTRFTLEATRNGDSWSVERMRYMPVKEGEKHSIGIQFGTPATGEATSSTIEIIAGKKNTIATGTLTLTGGPLDRTAMFEMKTPAWARGKVLQEETVQEKSGSAGASIVTVVELKP